VVAEGHVPTYSPRLADPRTGPVELVLKQHDLDRRDAALILRGRVLDENGAPVAGAVLEPFGMKKGDGAQFGGLRDVDALAVSNERGEFRIGVPEKGCALYLRAKARSLAPRSLEPLAAGPDVHEIRLVSGVTVTGKVVWKGKPLAGATLGLVQQNRSAEKFVGDLTIDTDDTGGFSFVNVPPDEAHFIYGIMDSFRRFGAIPVKAIRLEASGTSYHVGVLEVQPGHRLSGRVVLGDGKPVPPQTRVIIGREQAWDSQTAVAGKDGSFAFTGLPAERYSLNARVPGYHLSSKNASLDRFNSRLAGTVRADIAGLRLLLEAGPWKQPDFSKLGQKDFAEHERRQNSPLQGATSTVGPAPAPADKSSKLSVAEQIAEIQRQHEEREKKFYEELRTAGRDNDKVQKANENYQASTAKQAEILTGLIRQHRKEPVAFDGILVLLGKLRYFLADDLVELLFKDHFAHAKMGELCFTMRYNVHTHWVEKLFKEVAARHPEKAIRGQAVYALGDYYRSRAHPYGDKISDADKAKYLAEAGRFYTQAKESFADVRTPDAKAKLGDLAARELVRLKNIPNLKVSKQAPEIAGEDIDGQHFKLSDYRGKVVVLDFWGHW
jgi:hypothetical protein